MERLNLPIQIRWTDIDANRHLRHSAYYDYGAIARMNFFIQHELTTKHFEESGIGIILFREEALFKREIVYEDNVTIDITLTKASNDFSRWSIRHHIHKNDDHLAAIINVDGAWIDLTKRKLAAPDDLVKKVFSAIPRSEDFIELIRQEKE